MIRAAVCIGVIVFAAWLAVPLVGQEPSGPAPFSEAELTTARAAAQRFAKIFLAGREDEFGLCLIRKEDLPRVFSAETLGRAGDGLYAALVDGNLERFRQFRAFLGKTEGLEWQAFEAGVPTRSTLYGPEVRLMKGATVVVGYGARLVIRVRIEDLVRVGDEWVVTKLD